MKRAPLYYWVWVAVVIGWGASLRWQAIHGSLLADDWDHYAMDVGLYPIARHPLDRFNFVANDAKEREALIAAGRMPWWTDSAIHLAVFRPLSSALVQLDFEWLDAVHHPSRSHLHSMLWWAALICGVAGFLRSLLPPSAAGVAVLLFALHGSHGLPVVWTANRSELVAMTFIVYGLWAHAKGLRILASVAIGFGLLAGEHAIAPLMYLIGFECFAALGGARDRARALLPAAALTLMYLGVRAMLGYGVEGSSFYIDPLSDPARYLAASLTRLPRLVGDLVFGWPAESPLGPAWASPWLGSASIVPRLEQVQIGVGALALVLLGVTWAYAWRQRSEERWRHMHWLLACAMLSLLPVSGGLPMARLTMAAAIGLDATLGLVICALVGRIARGVRGRTRLAGALSAACAVVLLLGIHGFAAAARTRAEVTYYAARSHLEERWALRAELPGELADKHVMVICAPDWVTQFGMPYVWHLHGLPLPASTEVLSAAVDSAHVLTRTGPATLELRLESERPGRPFATSVYRAENSRFVRGEHVRAPRFDVNVREVRAGEPTRLEFVFAHALDDPRYVFLYPRPTGLVRVPMLEIGQSLRLPPPVWPGP